jgi:hypothetical protein
LPPAEGGGNPEPEPTPEPGDVLATMHQATPRQWPEPTPEPEPVLETAEGLIGYRFKEPMLMSIEPLKVIRRASPDEVDRARESLEAIGAPVIEIDGVQYLVEIGVGS